MATNEDLLKSLMDEHPRAGGNVFREAPAPPVSSSPVRTIPPRKALLDRSVIDRARPIVIFLVSVGLLGLSWVSTVAQVGVFLRLGYSDVSSMTVAIVGLLTALGITAGEVFGAETRWYLIFLVPDIAFTVWWLYPVFDRFLPDTAWGAVSTVIAAAIVGYISARTPEQVILGPWRRKG